MINIENLTVNYEAGESSITALSSIYLSIAAGEYIGFLGANGSGKSTLIKAICGLIKPETGKIIILGKEVRPGFFGSDFFGKVGVVFQEPQGQFLMPTVEMELLATLENLGLNYEQRLERLKSIIRLFNLEEVLEINPEYLSGGQMQLINLAAALVLGPDLLILDEPTTFLDNNHKARLLSYLRQFHRQGLTIIHVTQYPDESLDCDKIAILEKGRLAAFGSIEDVFSNIDLLSKCRLTPPARLDLRQHFGIENERDITTFCERLPIAVGDLNTSIPNRGKRPLLSLSGIQYSYGKSEFSLNIDCINLPENQILGIVGPVGSGKSTLAMIMSGLLKPVSGAVKINNESIFELNQKQIRKYIGMTFQLPDLAFWGPTLRDEIEFGARDSSPACDTPKLLDEVGLGGCESRIVDSLSGGEKRKLQIAEILANPPQVIVLDEPFAFLDSISQLEISSIIKGLMPATKSIVIISHDLAALSETVDRVAGILDGRLLFDIEAAEFFNSLEYIGKLGLKSDLIFSLRTELRKKGVFLPFNSLNPDKIYNYLLEMGLWA